MTVRVDVSPGIISWALKRARRDAADLQGRFPRIAEWGQSVSPTLKQLEAFAQATHAPIGMMFLREPPQEPLPIPDYRTMDSARVVSPSADLLDTIYQCQHRQDWYISYARQQGSEPVSVAGSTSPDSDPESVAAEMREALNFEPHQRGPSFQDALRHLSDAAELLGILVTINGVVGNDTHRKLDPEEFRGFALTDVMAPLVFVNGADSKGAQIFTLAHELAHVWAGSPGLDDADPRGQSSVQIEQWSNRVAASFLVPGDALRRLVTVEPESDEVSALSRRFKVSTLVILNRLRDMRLIGRSAYDDMYRSELGAALTALAERQGTGGGDFFRTQPARVGRTFARAVIESTMEGHTSYTEAFRMLGIRKTSTFEELASRLGVA